MRDDLLDEALLAFEAQDPPPDIDDFVAGWPEDLRAELRALIQVHLILTGLGSEQHRPPEQLGGYALEEELGRGGMGVVFRARDRQLDRAVAIKVVAIDPLNADRTQRFLREAKALARIRHPNVVGIHAFGREDDWLWIVMELLERPVSGPVDEATAVRWVSEAAAGVACCHEAGILHRDLKLDNLLLDADGVVKVTDFGVADVQGQPTLTRTGVGLGTPGFAAPEQLAGAETTDRTDVYGLGAVLYALLTGRGLDDAARANPSVRASRPVQDALRAALAVDPQRRPDLDGFVALLTTPSRPSRAPLWLGVALVALVIAVMVLGDRPRVPDLPGGYAIMWYERQLAERAPPEPEALKPDSERIVPSTLWETELDGLLRSRAPAMAVERTFDAYTVRTAVVGDVREVTLRTGGELRARIELGPADLFGDVAGWGLFRDIADEDGDGHKECGLVKVADGHARVVVLKWDPQALGSGWRLPGDFVLPAAGTGGVHVLQAVDGVVSKRFVATDGSVGPATEVQGARPLPVPEGSDVLHGRIAYTSTVDLGPWLAPPADPPCILTPRRAVCGDRVFEPPARHKLQSAHRVDGRVLLVATSVKSQLVLDLDGWSMATEAPAIGPFVSVDGLLVFADSGGSLYGIQ